MNTLKSWFDALPAAVQHALILFFGSYVGVVGQAIVAAQGVTSLAWATVLVHALNVAVVSLVGGLGILSLTPTTRQYGVGARGPAA